MRLRSANNSRISFFAFQDIITSVTGILILVTLILTLYLNPAGPEPATEAGRSATARQLALTQQQLAELNEANQLLQASLVELATAPDTSKLQQDIAALQAQAATLASNTAHVEAQIREEQASVAREAERLGVSAQLEQARSLEATLQALQQTNVQTRTAIRELETRQRLAEDRLTQLRREGHRLWIVPDTNNTPKQPLLVVVSGTRITSERFNRPESRREADAGDADDFFARALNELQPARDFVVFYLRPSGVGLYNRCRATAKDAGFEVGHDAIEEDTQLEFNRPR